mgnify:FL=1|tara:strand:- start:1697 stop:2170 length:474 start_codon:yes stop_codon:yes gene_type:complete
MKHYLVFGLTVVFTLSSYGQETKQKSETVTDSIVLATNTAKDAATLLRIEKAEKEAKNTIKEAKRAEKVLKRAEKEKKKLEKAVRKHEDLKDEIEDKKKDIIKREKKIKKYEIKLAEGQRKGKLSPVAIDKLNNKIAKENISILKGKEKLRKLERKQ